jgi:hypothetical protein
MEPTEVNANRFALLAGGRISLDEGRAPQIVAKRSLTSEAA